MNEQELQRNVAEFRSLDERRSADGWRMAELAYEATEGGMSQQAYADAVGYSQQKVSYLAAVWRRYYPVVEDERPPFDEAVEAIRYPRGRELPADDLEKQVETSGLPICGPRGSGRGLSPPRTSEAGH